MKHDFHLDNETRSICCTLEGELDIEQSSRISKSLREKAVELGFNVLYDASKLQEPKSDMPVHDFTVKLSSILDDTILRNVKVAFIHEPGTFDEYWQFYNNAATSRGLKVGIFVNKEEAIKWLSN